MLLYATVRRLLCLTLMALSLSCQAFVTSSRFPLGHALLRGGSLQPSNNDENTNNARVVGPLGVLRAPPSATRRSRNDEEGGEHYHPKNGASNGSSARRNGVSSSMRVPSKTFYTPSASATTATAQKKKKNGEPSSSPAFFRSKQVEYVAETKLPTDVGAFQLRGYRIPGAPLGQEPCVIYCRDKPPFGQDGAPAAGVPVRIHDQCLTSEVFRSQR